MCLHSRLDRDLPKSPVLSVPKFRSSAEGGGGGGYFRYRHLHSSFLQFSEFCHALGVKIALILLLRHFDNETIRVSNSERNGKYINQRENKLEIAAPSSQFVQIQYVGENGCPNLFSTKVIKSHVKLHVKSDA